MAVGAVQLKEIIAYFCIEWDDKRENFMMQELEGRIAREIFLYR